MKLKEIPYKRPDVDQIIGSINALKYDFENAESAAAQLEIFKKYEEAKGHFDTYSCLSNIRNSMDSFDPFYITEQEFYDTVSPKVTQAVNSFNDAVLKSPFKSELREVLGSYYFDCMEMQQRTFSEDIMELMAEENRLCTEYEQLYASAIVDFDGRKINLSQLAAYMQNPDREIRKAAVLADAKFFEDNREKFDSIYDKLVKNRDLQAKKLGFDNYMQVAYLKRKRAYSPEDVAKFRQQILEVIVPKNVEYKKAQAKAIGVEDFRFYDDDFAFPDGNPAPKYSPDEILKLCKQMFGEMSAETKELIDLMYDNELFDIAPRNGKRAAGYCVTIHDYGYPFIFFNANGTQGDIKTLTHECGHALAAYTTQKEIEYSSIRHAAMEACETHSMSMEFLSSPWHHLFFKEDAAKYSEHLAKSALYFIPYGIIVDYFQELVYTHPEWTPEERNAAWLKLENTYIPYNNFEGLPFYSRGGRWQKKIHIYAMPFYYIDYSVAQTLALQFFSMYLEDKESAWEKYMKFVKAGGRLNLFETIDSCGMTSVFRDGALAEICKPVFEWIDNLKK
ncbi:MAG: M3 family oligoendopeptidase [Oscillospiraceae bacterium]|nr:M3 family oligoendopeptidase [Oscillospiraceae bacterium]